MIFTLYFIFVYLGILNFRLFIKMRNYTLDKPIHEYPKKDIKGKVQAKDWLISRYITKGTDWR